MTPEFRVWDKLHKRSANVIEIDFFDGVVTLEDFDGTWKISLKDTVLEQHIGLEDKNGNKIFEGDIVISSWDEMQEGGPGLYIEAKGQVAFDEGCFGVYDNEQGFRPLFTMTLNELHVVGNIHKNPELLEADK